MFNDIKQYGRQAQWTVHVKWAVFWFVFPLTKKRIVLKALVWYFMYIKTFL